ncbi:MAG TPA: acetyltransferase [Desulfomonilaceae bacterium]|nr:acetyltransferase [Desulfomonilaceae bacterium]
MEKVFVIGAGGHAKVVIDAIEKAKLFEIPFLVDDDASLKGKNIFGYPVLGNRTDLAALAKEIPGHGCFVAIGNNLVRIRLEHWLKTRGFRPVTAIHPSAQIARGVRIGINTVIMAGAVINSDATVGTSVIVNTAAGVDHDCLIGDGTHIAPGCSLCGSVTVGPRTLIGAGTTVVHGVTIGSDVIVGAGSVVVENIPPNVIAMGNPARAVRDNRPESQP